MANMVKVARGNRKISVFATYEQMSDFAIKKWQEISQRAVADRGFFAVALSGGKTPAGFYDKLSRSKKGLPWDKTHIFLVDERFVPFDDDQSNYRMIREHLLGSIEIPTENIHHIPTRQITPEISSKKYESYLVDFFKLKPGEMPTFDLVMLGIGEDGHTASLFPWTSELMEKRRLAISVALKRLKNRRISLTLPVINNARNVIFLVSGENKAEVIKKILEEGDRMLPAARVTPDRANLFFLMDEKAASLLSVSYKKASVRVEKS